MYCSVHVLVLYAVQRCADISGKNQTRIPVCPPRAIWTPRDALMKSLTIKTRFDAFKDIIESMTAISRDHVCIRGRNIGAREEVVGTRCRKNSERVSTVTDWCEAPVYTQAARTYVYTYCYQNYTGEFLPLVSHLRTA